jgi:hypothetical protein
MLCADERLATKIETASSIAITLTTAMARSEDLFDPIKILTKSTGKLNILMTVLQLVRDCCESGRIHLAAKPRVSLSAFAFCDSSEIGG